MSSVANWRDKCSNIRDEQLYIFDNEIASDCTIIVYETDNDDAEQISIKVHKHILTRASTVFEVMLSGEYKENMDGMIRITDIRPAIMKTFLRFIYGQENINKDLEVEDILELIFASTKYNIPRLTNKFYSALKEKFLKLDYVFRIKNILCNKMSAPIFERIDADVFQIIKDETKQFLDLKDALEMTEEDLIKIVQADHLSLNNESELIEFVNNWAHYQLKKNELPATGENLRKSLKNIVPYLRVLTISEDMYIKTIDKYSWVTLDEKLAILKNVIKIAKLDDTTNFGFCKLTENRCIIKKFIVKIPTEYFPERHIPEFEHSISSLIIKPTADCKIHSILFKSIQMKNTAKATYNESIRVSIFRIIGKYETDDLMPPVIFQDEVLYNSVFCINIPGGVHISANKYYGINFESSRRSSSSCKLFEKTHVVRISDNRFELHKDHYNYSSNQPGLMLEIRCSVK